MKRFIPRTDWLVLGLLLIQFFRSLLWIASTWTDDTYQSVGFLALAVLVIWQRRLPPLRTSPSRPHLWGLVVVAVLDLLLWPLSINILSALFAVLCLHLWTVAFRLYRGRWYLHPQLLLGLLCLPAVYWLNVLFGFQLQQLVGRAAAAGLALYGLPTQIEGTLIRIGSQVIAVDSACSGVKLLVAGTVFGLLVQPSRGFGSRLLFWIALLLILLLANVTRVISLTFAHLFQKGPPPEFVHQLIGVIVFVLACSASLIISRYLKVKSSRFAEAI